MTIFPKITKKEAIADGYVSITKPYSQKPNSADRPWFNTVKEDLRGCDVVLVEFADGVEFWRHRRELNVDHNGVCISLIQRPIK